MPENLCVCTRMVGGDFSEFYEFTGCFIVFIISFLIIYMYIFILTCETVTVSVSMYIFNFMSRKW